MKWTILVFICLAAGCSQQVLMSDSSSFSVAETAPEESGVCCEEEIEVLTEGVSALTVQGGWDIARDNALDDALRKAVEQGVGAYIDAETQVENLQLLSDRIYSRTHGYVVSYRIIHEEQDDDLYRVVIRAVVNTGNIENDLAAIGILLSEQNRPRLMVVVRELDELSGLSNEDRLMDGIMFETMLLDHFRQKGFPVVDAATVEEILRRDQLRLILEGDDQTAALIGLEAGAEIVITGTALRSTNSRMIAGSLRDIHNYKVSCRAINTRTARVLAAAATTTEVPFSENQARILAVDTTADQLITDILDSWTLRENVTVILASNSNYTRVQMLRSELLLRLREVLDVIIRDYTGSRATLEVISEIGTQEVMDELASPEIGIDFEITGMGGNKIEIRFTD
ncbi:MAG: flagellar assembly protein T N-terminal domain-containing protein [Candidatus Aegiribacteria sp.]|nr:flagellar assembly protein T N-terminal domain-containing protein [Candidatus Aegiribacteria sp.]